MKLEVKDIDISSGGSLIAVLNKKDADKMDLHSRDRVKIVKGSKIETVLLNIGGSPLDSDQDGLTDQEEISKFGTNPLNPDSDNDTYLDGEEVSAAPAISGEVDWQDISVNLTAGPHALEWRYVKDNQDSEGDDAGWIDEVRIRYSGDILVDFVPSVTSLPDSYITSSSDYVEKINKKLNSSGCKSPHRDLNSRPLH